MRMRDLKPVALIAMGLMAGTAAFAAETPIPDSKTRPDSIMFASIRWLTPVDDVAAQLAAKGYKETPGARTKELLAADGKIFDAYAIIHARLDDESRVVRWEITVPSKGERNEYAIQRKIYDDMVAELLARYGRRQETVEKFRFPYVKGDPNSARGVRGGYVTIRSGWASKGGDRVQVEMTDDMSVALTYESRWWQKMEDERRRKKAKNL